MSETSPISLAEAQKRLNFHGDNQGRRLLRYLEGVERSKGVDIVRKDKRRSKARYLVTIAAIREHAPELIPNRTESLLRAAQEYLKDINERINERVDERCEQNFQRRIFPRLRKLEEGQVKLAKHQETTAETLTGLSKAVSRLA